MAAKWTQIYVRLKEKQGSTLNIIPKSDKRRLTRRKQSTENKSNYKYFLRSSKRKSEAN